MNYDKYIFVLCLCVLSLLGIAFIQRFQINSLEKRVQALEKFTASQIHSNSQERAIERILTAEEASQLEE